MNRENFIYDSKCDNLQKALDIYTNGGRILCAVCGSELIIIGYEDKTLITKYQLQPGIYCPVSSKHICAKFIFADHFEEFRQKFGYNE
ncbi:hypothetical protein NIES2109_32660 [Nostoc sp. HK-01]|uniref:Ribosomal protein S12 methylthiotransferase n=1 Tax=Nostoc cycadae WK-1 TaxID=1861711 RepID=A0A2H6LJB4_9NOSO|nr:hypothetical protein [Nostoc cycadae]BBD60469.1 hypothetical protein NIES2109_32660 [Nostoc sp. HK-01]GBE93305.1 ribosomal protein S12 methylthiotransferase [Nostoc cycadae WK-1]